MNIQTEKIPANNEAGYVIVNAEDVGTDAVAKWAPMPANAAKDLIDDMQSASDAGLLGGQPNSNAGTREGEGGSDEPEDLMKHTKAELVAMAEAKGVKIVPDEYTKQMIIDSIQAVNALPDADPAK